MAGKEIGEILLAQGVITREQHARALNHQRGKKTDIGAALVELGHVDEEQLAKAVATQHHIPYIDLEGKNIPASILDKVPAEIREQFGILPLAIKGGKLAVAIDDPAKVFQLDELRFVLNVELMPILVSSSGLKKAVRRSMAGDSEETANALAREAGGVAGEVDDAPIIRLVSRMIESAVSERASDIHIEPQFDKIRIRFRVDGALQDAATHPIHLHGSMISRLKIMAKMDIAEKRKPQDGRINVKVRGRDIDIRVSILPSNWGESMVMRLLDKETSLVSLVDLGFHETDYARFQQIIKRPNGIFLVTGPTGSGKTTTLYAALKELNRSDVKLITAEDPVEYHIPGINQVQVKHNIGLDFTRILRAMLRQAPNIILVGEIRDKETAEIAIQAALTGHLVFSTLHTNDAPSALARITDMGVKPFLVSSSIQAIMAQRLVRRLCVKCREEYTPEESELNSLGIRPEDAAQARIFRGRGCPECRQTGFLGRTGIYELMEMDWTLRDMTFQKKPTIDLRRQAISSGQMSTLAGDAIRKVLGGISSIREVLKAVQAEE
jgi:type IV pilus assembly protein PilB